MTETVCNCGKPTRDHASFCDDCGGKLSRALGEVPAVAAMIETTIAKRKGVDYRRVGGGSGGMTAPRGDKRIVGDLTPPPPTSDTPELGAAIQGDIGDWGAVAARDHLRGVLVAWVRFCDEEQVRHSSPHVGLPKDTLPSMARWLMWRVDGLALHDIGAEAVDEVTSAVAHCLRLVDRPPERQYLGECGFCGGRLYARNGSRWARCEACGAGHDAETLRTKLLAELDDRLVTAKEIGDLSVYFGHGRTREQVRKTVEYWARKQIIHSEASISDTATYRFGIVWRLLEQDEARRSA